MNALFIARNDCFFDWESFQRNILFIIYKINSCLLRCYILQLRMNILRENGACSNNNQCFMCTETNNKWNKVLLVSYFTFVPFLIINFFYCCHLGIHFSFTQIFYIVNRLFKICKIHIDSCMCKEKCTGKFFLNSHSRRNNYIFFKPRMDKSESWFDEFSRI